MKKEYIVLLVGMVFLHVACDDVLDKEPVADLSLGNFFKSESDFELAANNLYVAIDSLHSSSINGIDDTRSVDYFESNDISSGNHQVPNTDNLWISAYTTIRGANFLLEASETSEVEAGVRLRYEAEARFFRGMSHFALVQRFGDVPLVLQTLDFSEVTPPRDPRATVINSVVEDFRFAADNLPSKSELAGDELGRITRGMALGYLSRAALYEGTHAKFHSSGSDANALLTIARDAALAVINEGEYDLFAGNIDEIFFEANENNVEVMLSVVYEELLTTFSPRGRGHVIDAIQDPTKYLADAFLCTDGLPIDQSPLFQGYTSLTSEFENRDPRMEAVLWKPGTPFEGGQPMLPELIRSRTGYWPRKPGDPIATEVVFVFTDAIIMRYAEILLNYAEAVYELNESITDAELNVSINKLRDRAGMINLTNAHVTGNNLNMREEIRRERRVELAGEGFRYNDIIRWRIAETELPRVVLGTRFQAEEYPGLIVGTDVVLDTDGFIIAEPEANRSFDPSRHYLFPLPLREVNLNSDLTQNPNW
ncbi:RagB/SusD family nutrient uptake outer membrane protein [Ulvibacterium sp.]|uniref:RagB/SusD family nutrient uptake outer membrane protein n=1 Tax=Ulvibacterium sp. TaxID=2665914 RepID=UPI003BA96FF6